VTVLDNDSRALVQILAPSTVTDMQLTLCTSFHGPCSHQFPVSGIATPAGTAIGVVIRFYSHLVTFSDRLKAFVTHTRMSSEACTSRSWLRRDVSRMVTG
jgi:hypothetical protein